MVRTVVVLTLAFVSIAAFAWAPDAPRPRVPPRGFGSGPVTPAVARTPAWAAVAAFDVGVDASSTNDCRAGRTGCLTAIVGEMSARLDRLGCAHTAPFAFTYLEMTKAVARQAAERDFFLDVPQTVQLDAVFAGLYFDAFDNWQAGRHDEVPGAWRLAFAAAEDGRTSAAADMFLGMNAHISRDLAYAVARALTTVSSGAGDATDFGRINGVIASVQGPMLDGASRRFDPALATLPALVPADSRLDTVDLIALWRQVAFDLGRRLANAATPDERAAVEAEIERGAVAGAVMILNADAAARIEVAPFDRDAYCAAHR